MISRIINFILRYSLGLFVFEIFSPEVIIQMRISDGRVIESLILRIDKIAEIPTKQPIYSEI